MSKKIISLSEIGVESGSLKSRGEKVVLCHGTFDLLHIGHVKHLQKARQYGSKLIVSITADKFVNKGPDRPVFPAFLRAENLAALECVDYVTISDSRTSEKVIEVIKPDIYVKGIEYQNIDGDITGNIKIEIDAVEKAGGTVVFTNELTFSSTKILNNFFGVFPPHLEKFISEFKKLYSVEEILASLDSLKNLKVLVVGDAIVDQYHYVSPMGQTGKGNVLSARYLSEEEFGGGSVAVANHVGGFADRVELLTALGRKNSKEAFIRANLNSSVTPSFCFYKNSSTVIKRRFVDTDLQKLFEVYICDELPLLEDEKFVIDWLKNNVAGFDLVLVSDFGNGFITDEMRRVLCDHAKFLAVNAQINSANRGYHSVDSYKSAHYVSANEPEMRLAFRDKVSPIESVACEVGRRLTSDFISVTRGTKGAICFDLRSSEQFEVPALTTSIVDRIGAGDAFLSLSSLCLAGRINPRIAVFIGSAAAAMDVQIVGNRETLNIVDLKKYVVTLLK